MNCSKPHKLCWCLLKFQKDLDNPSSSASAQVLSSHNAPNSSVPPPRVKPLGTHRNFPEHRVRRTITLTLGGVKRSLCCRNSPGWCSTQQTAISTLGLSAAPHGTAPELRVSTSLFLPALRLPNGSHHRTAPPGRIQRLGQKATQGDPTKQQIFSPDLFSRCTIAYKNET